jgi:spore coat protein H
VTSEVDIDMYSLYVKPKLLRKLESNIWSSKLVDGTLRYLKNDYRILLSYRGAYTRKFPKKPYFIKFVTPESFNGNKELHLNAEYIDPSLMRARLSFDFFNDIGVHAPKAKHILLKLNGKLLGIYLQLEAFDELFLQKRGLNKGAIYYAINDDANFSLLDPDNYEPKEHILSGYKRKCGTEEDDNKLIEFLYKINITPRDEFEDMIKQYLNVKNYLTWLAGVVCTMNYDGFIQNYTLYENSINNLYEMSPWDYDATWGRDVPGRELELQYVPITGFNTLTARLLDIPSIRKQYKEILENVISTYFTTEYMEPKIQELYHQLKKVITLDPFKKNFVKKFDAEPEYILEFIKNRNQYLKDNMSLLD